ncbi:MAG TPA: hypothetical protein VJ464_14585 [Blastocatellia bacterium]|nr:hypothetical protein [Blastocatellia bacterium]
MPKKSVNQGTEGPAAAAQEPEALDAQGLKDPKLLAGLAGGTALAVLAPEVLPVLAIGAAVFVGPKLIAAYKQGGGAQAANVTGRMQGIFNGYVQFWSPVVKAVASVGQKAAAKVGQAANDASEKLGRAAE